MSEYPPGSKKKSGEKKGFTPEKVVSRLERDYLALAEKLRKKNIQPEELSPEMWGSANGILEEARAVVAEYNKTKNEKRKISLLRELQGLGKSLKNAEKNLLRDAEIFARIPRETDRVEPQVEPVESTTPHSVLDFDFSDPNANSLPDLELSGDDSTPLDINLSADKTTSLDFKLSDDTTKHLDLNLEGDKETLLDLKLSNDTMKHFDIDLSQLRESTPSQSTEHREMRINPDDVPEYIKEDLVSREDTRAGWYSRMRELVHKVVDTTKEGFTKSKDFLTNRDTSLTEKAKTLGKGTNELLLNLGEQYRKTPLKYKIALSAALIGGSLATGGASTFVTVLSAAKLGQRSVASAGVYALVNGLMEKRLANKEEKGIERTRMDNAIKHFVSGGAALAVFSGLPGLALKEGFDAVGGGQLVSWLGNALGHTPTPDIGEVRTATEDVAGKVSAPAPAVSDVPRPTTPTTTNIIEKIVDKVPKIPSEKIGFYDPSGEQQRLTELRFVQKDIDAPESAPSDTLVPPSGEGSGTTSAQANIVEGPNTNITPDVRERAEAWVVSNNSETAPASAPSAEPVLGKPEAPVPQAPEPAPTPVETDTPSPGSASDFINPEQATSTQSTPETPVLENPPAEHLREFVNANNISVDPLHGHIFESTGGKVFAYGNDFSARYDTALDYAIAHPNTSVFVQAEKPALDLATGKLNLWVHEIKYEKGLFGIGGGIKILNPIGPTSPDQIISVNPDTFTKQLDK
jgi:hypothetical protein